MKDEKWSGAFAWQWSIMMVGRLVGWFVGVDEKWLIKITHRQTVVVRIIQRRMEKKWINHSKQTPFDSDDDDDDNNSSFIYGRTSVGKLDSMNRSIFSRVDYYYY